VIGAVCSIFNCPCLFTFASSVDCWLLWKMPVPLKRAGFILPDVQSDVLLFSRIHFCDWPIAMLKTFCDMLPHVSMRHCFKSPVSHHFRGLRTSMLLVINKDSLMCGHLCGKLHVHHRSCCTHCSSHRSSSQFFCLKPNCSDYIWFNTKVISSVTS